MKTRFLITSICLFVVGSMSNAYAGAGAAGHEHSAYKFGQPGNPKKPSRVIEIKMTDSNGEMKFSPKAIEIKKGEQIKFKIRNIGELDHEVVIDTLPNNLKHAEEMMKNPDMEHDDPNAKRLGSKKSGEIVWLFNKPGTFDFSCLIPGHREAGMTGKIVVR